jgi:hypothetical protein
MPNPKKPRRGCRVCGKEVGLPVGIYCSTKCQREFCYREYIERWKRGEVSGSCKGECCSPHVRRYLTEIQEEQCAECGWDKRHPITKKVPLQIHHINGDPDDNSPENVVLLCPNCHSLTSTFGALNKGKGRGYRYRKGELPA